MELNCVRVAQGYARLFEAQLDAAAELARDVVLAIEDGADLKPENRAVERKGFDAEDARAVNESGGPIGVAAEVACNFFESGEGTAD